MGIFDPLLGLDKRDAKLKEELAAKVDKSQEQVVESVTKAVFEQFAKQQSEVFRYRVDPSLNNTVNSKRKPKASVSFATLRKFSEQHEISRACINARKRHLTTLEWDIVPEEEEDKADYTSQKAQLKDLFQTIGGRTNPYRTFLSKMVEDLMVLDAISIYKQPTLGGDLFKLIPVDAATVRVKVDETGDITGYRQIIDGRVVAEFDVEELIYAMMNPRTNSPYGLAPLESLLMVVSSSLKAGMSNLAYLTEGNTPEGLFMLPEDWTPSMIREFEENWNAVMAGDDAAMARIKFTPPGNFVPTRKHEDMQWEQFNMWLLKVTCSLFDVQPIEIGFEPQGGLGGKGFSEGQNTTTQRKSIIPLANFFQEIFTQIIHEDLGMPSLRFKFMGLDPQDKKNEAEVAKIQIESGQRTINETRKEQGLEPYDDVEAADRPFLLGGTPTFIDDETVEMQSESATEAPVTAPEDAQSENTEQTTEETMSEDDTAEKTSQSDHVLLVTELRKFKKMALTRKREGKSFRPFVSEVLPSDVVDEMNSRLEKADLEESKQVFRDYMQDYQVSFISNVMKLREDLQKVLK